MRTMDRRRRRQLWVSIVFSLVSFIGIFIFIEPVEILTALWRVRPAYLLLCALGILGFMAVRAARWQFMLQADIPYRRVFHIQSIGYMLLNILPFRVGDVARAMLIGRAPPLSVARGLSTIVVERILDLAFMVALFALIAPVAPRLPAEVQLAARASGIVAAAALMALFIAANQQRRAHQLVVRVLERFPFLDAAAWTSRVDELLAGLGTLARPGAVVWLIILSIVTWLPIIGAYYAGLLAVNLEPTWVTAAFVVCAAGFTVSAPSSPGQVGVFHAGVTFALVQLLGQPAGPSASFALVYHALNVFLMVGLGVIGILSTGLSFSNVVQSARSVGQ